jgi:chemotaxis protein MotB
MDELSQEKAQAIAEMEKSIAELKKTHDSMVGAMQEEIQKGEITITQLKDKLTLSMVEAILFDSGSAKVKKNGEKVLDRVAEVLKKVTDKQIRIEGYTDNVPIGGALAEKFPTNWELSTARATNVVRYLQRDGIDPQLLGACGYSEYRPIAANDTEEGKAKNRRIEVVLTPKDFVKVTAE